VEADIALNPAYSWTLDNEYAARESSSAWSFEREMLHELGHGWGLQHPWEYQDVWWDSIENRAPKRFRLPTLFADDTQASRTAYPGTTLHDGLISCYTTEDDPYSNEANYVDSIPQSASGTHPPQVEHGAEFWLSNYIKIENTGTDDLVAPGIELYLTPERMSWDSCQYLVTKTSSTTIPPFTAYYGDLGTTVVPYWVPPGVYYLGLFLRDDNDSLLGNNSSWTNYLSTLVVIPHCQTPPAYDETLYPGPNWQTTSTTQAGIGDCTVYRLILQSSGRYDFSLCGNDGVGGFADPGDADMWMYDASGALLWYIDGSPSCAYDASTLGTSFEGWSPPVGGYYYLKVVEFWAEQLTFDLAFRGSQGSSLIFSDGFESGNTSAWTTTIP